MSLLRLSGTVKLIQIFDVLLVFLFKQLVNQHRLQLTNVRIFRVIVRALQIPHELYHRIYFRGRGAHRLSEGPVQHSRSVSAPSTSAATSRPRLWAISARRRVLLLFLTGVVILKAHNPCKIRRKFVTFEGLLVACLANESFSESLLRHLVVDKLPEPIVLFKKI